MKNRIIHLAIFAVFAVLAGSAGADVRTEMYVEAGVAGWIDGPDRYFLNAEECVRCHPLTMFGAGFSYGVIHFEVRHFADAKAFDNASLTLGSVTFRLTF